MQGKEETYWSPWSSNERMRDEEKFVRRGELSPYKAGDVIFQQGAPCSGYLFYLYAGRVAVHTVGLTGEEKTHFILEKGSFFGEAAFFVQNCHIAAAIAREDSQVVKLSAKILREMFGEDPELPFDMLLMLSRKIHQLASQVDDLSYLAINQRLGRLLLKLAQDFGREEEAGIILPLNITDEELGKLVGARRETVSRVLGSLRDLGIVEKIKRKICVRDFDGLRAYVNQD